MPSSPRCWHTHKEVLKEDRDKLGALGIGT